MVTLELYLNKAENIVVDKTNYLTKIDTITGNFRDNVTLLNPTIVIESGNYGFVYADYIPVIDENGTNVTIKKEVSSLPACNYIYIKEFERYYYVENIVIISPSLFELHCSIDILMSYKNGINTLEAFVERNQFTYNPRIIDSKRIIEQGNTKEIIKATVKENVFINIDDSIENKENTRCFSLTGYMLSDTPPHLESQNYKINLDLKADDNYGVGFKYLSTENNLLSGKFSRSFYLTYNDVDKLAEYLKDPNISFAYWKGDPKNYLQSLIFFPMNLLPVYREEKELYILGELPNNPNERFTGVNADYGTSRFDLGEIDIKNSLNKDDFTSYNGYTKMKLYLPYYGFYELDTNEVIDKFIEIMLAIDVRTGQAMYTILTNDESIKDRGVFTLPNKIYGCRIVKTITFQLGIQIPLGSTNATEIYRNLINGGIKLAGVVASAIVAPTMISTAVGTVSGISTVTKRDYSVSNPRKIGFKTSTERSYESTRETTYDNTKEFLGRKASEAIEVSFNSLANMTGSGTTDIVNNSYLSAYNSVIPSVYVYKPNLVPVGDDYAELRGLPLGETKVLGELKGYTEISEVRIKGDSFSSITNEEKNILTETLLNGFIL